MHTEHEKILGSEEGSSETFVWTKNCLLLISCKDLCSVKIFEMEEVILVSPVNRRKSFTTKLNKKYLKF
jgi:hypothetical protein